MSAPKRIILILSLCIVVGCGAYLGKYFYDSYRAAQDISELQHLVEAGNSGGSAGEEELQGGNEAAQDNAGNEQAAAEAEQYAPNGMLQGYYDAYQKNNDMVGWLKISGTKINYPVMHRPGDNEYYLHRNFEKEYQYSGLPFLDGDCDISLPSDNLIIYAHNMRDGSMFAHLLDYEDEDFFRENPTISFDTNYKRGTYAIFAVFSTKVGSSNEFEYYSKTMFDDKADFDAYVKQALDRSYYETYVDVIYGDKLITLSTCSYHRSNERTVVMAKKIS